MEQSDTRSFRRQQRSSPQHRTLIILIILACVFVLLIGDMIADSWIDSDTILIGDNVWYQFNSSYNLTDRIVSIGGSKLDLNGSTISVTPSTGRVNITLVDYTTTYWEWNVSAVAGVNTTYVICGLISGMGFEITKGGVYHTGCMANSSGCGTFNLEEPGLFQLNNVSSLSGNINNPTPVQRNNIFHLTANLTTTSGIFDLKCNLSGEITDFYNITDYPLNKDLGNLSAGENLTITWILAAPYTLGYYTLNVSCNAYGFTTLSTKIKTTRG